MDPSDSYGPRCRTGCTNLSWGLLADLTILRTDDALLSEINLPLQVNCDPIFTEAA